MMQVCLFVVSFSIDFVCLSLLMQEKPCGSVDSIGLAVVVKGVCVCVGRSKHTVCMSILHITCANTYVRIYTCCMYL